MIDPEAEPLLLNEKETVFNPLYVPWKRCSASSDAANVDTLIAAIAAYRSRRMVLMAFVEVMVGGLADPRIP